MCNWILATLDFVSPLLLPLLFAESGEALVDLPLGVVGAFDCVSMCACSTSCLETLCGDRDHKSVLLPNQRSYFLWDSVISKGHMNYFFKRNTTGLFTTEKGNQRFTNNFLPCSIKEDKLGFFGAVSRCKANVIPWHCIYARTDWIDTLVCSPIWLGSFMALCAWHEPRT